MDTVNILGTAVHPLDLEGAVDAIVPLVAGRGHLVATVNPEFVMLARRDVRFREVLESASLRLPDGWGITWAARRLGRPLPERVPGTDLLPALARQAAARGWRVFLLGGAPGVAEGAAAALRRQAPGLFVAGCFAGDAGPQGDEETRAAVAAAAPDLVFVAYGAPRQEFWIDRVARPLGVPVAIGVGGAFDYLAGRVPRAPSWMRERGLEWTYRLARQPWRARRMLALPAFAVAILREAAGRPAQEPPI